MHPDDAGSEVEVVLGKLPDFTQLARLREAAGWDRVPLETLAQQFAGSRWFVTAWRGPQLVGAVRAISDGITNGYICGLVVDENLRKHGIGRRLLNALIEPSPTVRWVLHARPAAEGFYQACGFSPAEGMFRRDRAAFPPSWARGR